jgi:IS5 family transposase
LERRFGEVYEDGPGQPPLPTRLMAGLAILKHTYDVSDEVLGDLAALVQPDAEDRTLRKAVISEDVEVRKRSDPKP